MDDTITILRACFALTVLWAFWHFAWKPYSVDLLRQSLFPIRNRLFDMALNNTMGLEFDTPAYGALRQSFNSRIRYAHRITFSHLLWAMIVSKINGIDFKTFKPRVDIEIEAVENKELSKKLQDIKFAGDILFLRHLILTSPILWLILLAVGFYAFFRFGLTASLISTIRKTYSFVRLKGIQGSRRVVDFQADDEDGDGSPQGRFTQAA